MELTSLSSGSKQRGQQRKKVVFTPSQRDTLQVALQENPYPGIATRERLAKVIGIPEERVQVWFKNHRRVLLKKRRPSSEDPLGENIRGREKLPRGTPENVHREARRRRAIITKSQANILLQAFGRSRFPGISVREDLARSGSRTEELDNQSTTWRHQHIPLQEAQQSCLLWMFNHNNASFAWSQACLILFHHFIHSPGAMASYLFPVTQPQLLVSLFRAMPSSHQVPS
ncbi:PREDICTED: double homeobox protein 4-like protein 4-like [Elephantulus edwardii]|uniref:double homeobox protein 4-like protein 4-like n=1 Tax=Elephantulus edwardii TaxID=28737 RepID=UPI0003F06788|nr:PREDICTED: double homeobox protein 4-like protein 4-like [Elephantulus edwardii]